MTLRRRPPDAFICHAERDSAVAHRVRNALVNAGCTVWLDKIDLPPGTEWEPSIYRTIRECRYFLCLVSRNSCASQYARREVAVALSRYDRMLRKREFLIPVRIEEVEMKPRQLRAFQAIDLLDPSLANIDKILRIIRPHAVASPLIDLTAVMPALALNEAAGALTYDIAFRAVTAQSLTPDRTYVVGMMGAAGLGKTTLCEAMTKILNRGGDKATHVKLDGYLLNRATRNGLGVCGYEPGGWDPRVAERQLNALISKHQPVDIPEYLPEGIHGQPRTHHPSRIVILDGNYIAFGRIRSLVSLLIYAHSDLTTMEYLRFDKDTKQQRFSKFGTKKVWWRELPALQKYILPKRSQADVVIDVDARRRRRLIGARAPGSTGSRAE